MKSLSPYQENSICQFVADVYGLPLDDISCEQQSDQLTYLISPKKNVDVAIDVFRFEDLFDCLWLVLPFVLWEETNQPSIIVFGTIDGKSVRLVLFLEPISIPGDLATER